MEEVLEAFMNNHIDKATERDNSWAPLQASYQAQSSGQSELELVMLQHLLFPGFEHQKINSLFQWYMPMWCDINDHSILD